MNQVKFHHVRYYNEDGLKHNMGGATIAFVENPKDNSIRYALALCSPYDNFSKARGRTIASGRLKSETYATTVYDVSVDQFLSSFENFLE